jgi:hypothetical protein
VRRYAAQPQARAYLLRHYTPTGHLGRPMLALHTIYDPVVPVSQLTVYAHQVQSAGFGGNLVQQYVPRDGHCNLTPDEEGLAFDELVQWTHGSPRPATGLLREIVRPVPLRQQALRISAVEHGASRQVGAAGDLPRPAGIR